VSYNIAAVSGETRMTMTITNLAIVSLTAAVLAGCSSMNVFKDDAAAPAPMERDLAPEDNDVAVLESRPVSSGLRSADINKALAGKSWKWSTERLSGVTLYANDGSSLVEVTGNGTSTVPAEGH
jgi:hypothetical protein